MAGILGANALLGNKLTSRQMLTLATAIEGHPDNVAPAMLGGFVTSVYDEGQVYSVKKNIDEQLAFAAFVPDFRLLTSKRAPRCRIWSAIRTPCIICPAPRWLLPQGGNCAVLPKESTVQKSRSSGVQGAKQKSGRFLASARIFNKFSGYRG